MKKNEQPAFQAWAIRQLNAHLAFLTDPLHTDDEKKTYLADATRLRAFFNPGSKAYGGMYAHLRDAIDGWFTANRAALGQYFADVRGLMQVTPQEVGHEAQMKTGLGSALAALPGTAAAGAKGLAGSRGAAAGRPSPADRAPDAPAPTDAGTPESEYESFNSNVKEAFGKGGLKRYLAVRGLFRTRKETAGNPAGWLNQLQFGAPFCGTKLYGVHPKLLAVLQGVEEECKKFTAAVRAAGAPVVFQGQFQPRAVTNKPKKLSDHALGLALHLNYANNPYVGRNEAASTLIARLAAGTGQPNFWATIGGTGRKTTQTRVEAIYHGWAAASDAVAKYFREMDALAIKDKAGELDAAGKTELARRTQEYWQLRNSDLAKHRDPKNGVFMHTTQVEGDPMLQIIKQLTGPAGLEWGGTYTSRPKDLHHFALKI